MIAPASIEATRSAVRALMPRAKEDLTAMVSFRSVYDAAQFPPEECHRMAQWAAAAFKEVGFADARCMETPDGSNAVVGSAPGPAGAPTVLLYFHHDVQPPLDDKAWNTPVWELTERNGRWYGRGAADCKGNIAMHLAALRTFGGKFPVNLRIVGEGSEEQGTGGLEEFVTQNPGLFEADIILVCDSGNFAVGQPSLTTTLRGTANVVVSVETLRSPMHSGEFGGAAPDALAALIQMLATLRDGDGNTTVKGLANDQVWDGMQYPASDFRKDATLLDDVDVIGSGTIADMLWARPALTVLGIDCPPVVGSSAAIQPRARARLNLRVPPGMDAGDATTALTDHLKSVAPWHARITVEPEGAGQPFVGSTSGEAYDAMVDAMRSAYGVEVTDLGQGGSIPLCTTFQETYPDAQILLLGVEEPACLIHAPNESVNPTEIENMAIVEALFLQRLGEDSLLAR